MSKPGEVVYVHNLNVVQQRQADPEGLLVTLSSQKWQSSVRDSASEN